MYQGIKGQFKQAVDTVTYPHDSKRTTGTAKYATFLILEAVMPTCGKKSLRVSEACRSSKRTIYALKTVHGSRPCRKEGYMPSNQVSLSHIRRSTL